MSTSAAPNLNLNSYLKFSATLSDLDGWTVFNTGCPGCWSLRRRIASFKREDTEACKLPAAILHDFAISRSPQRSRGPFKQFGHRWLITRRLWGRYVHLCTVLPLHVLPLCVMPICVMYGCVMPACVIPLCVMPVCVLPLCVMPSLRFVSLRDACLRDACFRYASLRDACLRDAWIWVWFVWKWTWCHKKVNPKLLSEKTQEYYRL